MDTGGQICTQKRTDYEFRGGCSEPSQIPDITKGSLATFPGNLFQCLIIRVVKKFSLQLLGIYLAAMPMTFCSFTMFKKNLALSFP